MKNIFKSCKPCSVKPDAHYPDSLKSGKLQVESHFQLEPAVVAPIALAAVPSMPVATAE